MQLPPKETQHQAVSIDDHPKRIAERVREAATNADDVMFSMALNDQDAAAMVQPRTILKCLREGTLIESSLKCGGGHAKGTLFSEIGGEFVYVEFFIGPTAKSLLVIGVTAEEEE